MTYTKQWDHSKLDLKYVFKCPSLYKCDPPWFINILTISLKSLSRYILSIYNLFYLLQKFPWSLKLDNQHCTCKWTLLCDRSRLHYSECPCAWQLYCLEFLHPQGHPVTATVFKDTINETVIVDSECANPFQCVEWSNHASILRQNNL